MSRGAGESPAGGSGKLAGGRSHGSRAYGLGSLVVAIKAKHAALMAATATAAATTSDGTLSKAVAAEDGAIPPPPAESPDVPEAGANAVAATSLPVVISTQAFNRDLKPMLQRIAFSLVRRGGVLHRGLLEVPASELAGSVALGGTSQAGPSGSGEPTGDLQAVIAAAGSGEPSGDLQADTAVAAAGPSEPSAASTSVLDELQALMPTGMDAWTAVEGLASDALSKLGDLKEKLKEAFRRLAAPALPQMPLPTDELPPPPLSGRLVKNNPTTHLLTQ